MVKPGVYLGKAVQAAMTSVGQAGKPAIKITFSTVDGNISWNGWLTEKTAERTIGVLTLLGFRGSEDDLYSLSIDKLDKNAEVELAVKFRTNEDGTVYVDDKGKNWCEVAFVNPIGGSAFKNVMSPAEAKSKLSNLGIGSLLASKRAELPPAVDKQEEIPF